MSDTGAYKKDDLVWAKMKGFSPWPGMIATPPAELRKTPKKTLSQCIYFFGTNNYAWIEENNIKPYHEFKEQLVKTSKSAGFKEAVEKIELYILDPKKFDAELATMRAAAQAYNQQKDNAQFDKLRDEDTTEEAESVPPKKTPKKKVESKKKSILGKNKSEDDGFEPIASKRKRDETKTIAPKSEVDGDGIPISSYHSTHRRETQNRAVTHFLNRPATIARPPTPELDMSLVSTTLRSKNIFPSQLRFGFLGLGIMGSGIVKNLMNSGHKVVVWNRTYAKCRKFIEAGAEVGHTPSDVVDATDITFSCVADPHAAKDMVFGNCGVLSAQSIGEGKGYVEMTSIDSDSSHDIHDAITQKGGRYLEAQIQGSKPQAEEGTLIVLVAGDRPLFEECQTCFEAMGKNSFFLGEVGNASKMNLVLQMMSGVTLAGLAESLALADRAGLQQKDVLEVLELTNVSSPLIIEKGNAIIKSEFPTHQPLNHMQKDLKLALGMADVLEQPLPLTAASNEVYKHAKRLGYGEHDASAVYYLLSNSKKVQKKLWQDENMQKKKIK